MVYRFFQQAVHAEALTSGRVWISTLDVCRRYEDPNQGDPEEGFIRYNTGEVIGGSGQIDFELVAARAGIGIGPGCSNIFLGNNTSVNRLRDAFVLCTTLHFDPNVLSEVFGGYCVQISEPAHFFELVTQQLVERYRIAEAAYGSVLYKERSYTGLEAPPGPLGFVKPADLYSDQREFRFLWTVQGNAKLEPLELYVPPAAVLCRRVA